MPTCNLSEIVHNKWQQASGGKISDLYQATLDDYARAALQSLFYFNYLRGGPSGTGPSRSELQLRLAARNGNTSRVVKLMEEVTTVANVNTRIPHLEGDTIFGSTKRKLNLPPGDDSDSHRHDRVNFSIPKLGMGMSPAQARSSVNAKSSIPQPLHLRKTSRVLSPSWRLSRSPSQRGSPGRPLALTKNGLQISESPCADPTDWHIERIEMDSLEHCRGQSDGKKCGAKIARYRRAVAPPTFMGIERESKSKDLKQVQFWFCPRNILSCVLGSPCKSIMYYPDVPEKWPVKIGSSLTQSEMTAFEAAGFVLDDGEALLSAPISGGNPGRSDPRPSCERTTVMPTASKVVVPESPFPFDAPFNAVRSRSMPDGDKHPSTRDGKPFRFVVQPSSEHLKKMEDNGSIDCKILKYVKIPTLGYGMVLTICTPNSLDRKSLYDVCISNYPSCSYPDFKFMKSRAN